MKFNNNPYYYISIFIITCISFSIYSSNFYPLLNSDDALNILMAHYYKLPNDIYCWGQDRGGTFIPLISQLFIKLFNSSALTAVSLSNYLILIMGYFAFSTLFKTNYSKIVFGIIWFLPFQRFIDILRYTIGVEYSLIAVAIFFIQKINYKDSFNTLNNKLLLIAIVITFMVSVWVSDLAIVTICILLGVLLIFDIVKRGRISINKPILYYSISGLIACFLWIMLAKTYAPIKTEHYLALNNAHAVKEAFQIIITRFTNVLAFQTNEMLVSMYCYCVFVFLMVLGIYILKKKWLKVLISNKWVTFFIADFTIIFAVFLLSHWVLANEMGRWYFVASYISISLAILLAIENLSGIKEIRFLKWGLLFIVLLGAVSPVYTMKYNNPKTLKPMVDVVGEFKQLGEIGLIGEYWNSYIASCADPDMIRATPHDQSNIRNQKLVDLVFERKNLYVIKDMWLKEFPDTLEQFGYVLVKEGNQFRLGGCYVCKYNKMKVQKVFSYNTFTHTKSQLIFDNSVKRNVLFIPSTCDTCKEKHVMHGPFIPIGIGAFTARFYIKANQFINDKSIAMLDVSANWGAIQLASKKIMKVDFADNNYICINLDFKTCKRYNGIEFRIYYYGIADLYFDHLELTEK